MKRVSGETNYKYSMSILALALLIGVLSAFFNQADNAADRPLSASRGHRSTADIIDSLKRDVASMGSTGNPDRDFTTAERMLRQYTFLLAKVEIAQGNDKTIKDRARQLLSYQKSSTLDPDTEHTMSTVASRY